MVNAQKIIAVEGSIVVADYFIFAFFDSEIIAVHYVWRIRLYDRKDWCGWQYYWKVYTKSGDLYKASDRSTHV